MSDPAPLDDRIMAAATIRPAVLLAALAPVAAVAWLYADVLPPLVRQWASDDDYSHGFFVAPLAAFFAWQQREALARAARRPSVAGLVVVLLGLLLFAAGQLGSELFLSRASIIPLAAGLILFLLGPAHLRILAFPLAFLVLMVPLPEILFSRITFPLQTLASRLGEMVIAGCGIPVLREGNILQLPGRSLEVAEACSGIRSLITLVMLAIVLGYFTEPRPGARVAIALAAVPIAVVANALRVAGTGLMSFWVSPAAADGFFHTFSGWLVFLVALAGLLAFHAAIEGARRRWPRRVVEA